MSPGKNPSIQGMWNSFTNVDPKIALAQFPNVSWIDIISLDVDYRLKLGGVYRDRATRIYLIISG